MRGLFPNSGIGTVILEPAPEGKEDAQKLIARGVKLVAVTMGSKGCFWSDGSREGRIDAFNDGIFMVDTTGAGDIFIGTALSAMEKLGCDLAPTKEQMEKTLKIACYASSLSVRCKGATYDLNALQEKFPEMK